MSLRTIAVKLKIPDNEAYTALTALRRLGVDIARLERAEIWQLEDTASPSDFTERVERNETLFNPNKHELQVLEGERPREGEAWIEQLDAQDVSLRIAGVTRARRYVGWRLFSQAHTPADPLTVRAAVDQLLCNPAIERSLLKDDTQ
jgi:phosphoribosylformylglycinamidine (FGAM) synthase PurS component